MKLQLSARLPIIQTQRLESTKNRGKARKLVDQGMSSFGTKTCAKAESHTEKGLQDSLFWPSRTHPSVPVRQCPNWYRKMERYIKGFSPLSPDRFNWYRN